MRYTAVRAVAASLLALTGSAFAQDEVARWNGLLLDSVREARTNPPMASRAMAMVNTAMYDAVNSIARTHTPYFADIPGDASWSREAAAACAAHATLTGLYPDRASIFDAALDASLSGIPDGDAKTNGMSVGLAVAGAISSWRQTDGYDLGGSYAGGTEPGQWRPTPPGFGAALLPRWGEVTPWAMTSGSQFRADAPPALSSPEYAAAYSEVKDLGRVDSATRTAEQTEIARFWADGGGTETPPGHWMSIALNVAEDRGVDLVDKARLMAMLGVAVADSGIGCWDTKYEYGFWRPVTAIQDGELDDNPDTEQDDLWTSLIVTPPFPEYTSGHATFSASSAAILAAFFGTDAISFATDSDGLTGVTRTFESFSDAAEEAGKSRIYGGIHFEFANQLGQAMGRDIASWILANYFKEIPAPGAIALLGLGGLAAVRRRRA